MGGVRRRRGSSTDKDTPSPPIPKSPINAAPAKPSPTERQRNLSGQQPGVIPSRSLELEGQWTTERQRSLSGQPDVQLGLRSEAKLQSPSPTERQRSLSGLSDVPPNRSFEQFDPDYKENQLPTERQRSLSGHPDVQFSPGLEKLHKGQREMMRIVEERHRIQCERQRNINAGHSVNEDNALTTPVINDISHKTYGTKQQRMEDPRPKRYMMNQSNTEGKTNGCFQTRTGFKVAYPMTLEEIRNIPLPPGDKSIPKQPRDDARIEIKDNAFIEHFDRRIDKNNWYYFMQHRGKDVCVSCQDPEVLQV